MWRKVRDANQSELDAYTDKHLIIASHGSRQGCQRGHDQRLVIYRSNTAAHYRPDRDG